MAWELSSDLQKQVKDDQEYSESELFESEKSDSNSETEGRYAAIKFIWNKNSRCFYAKFES